MPQVGLKNLVYAKMISDDKNGIVYGSVKQIAGAINAKLTPNVSTEKLYADDTLSEIASTISDVGVELEAKDISLSIQADILGHTVANGVLIQNKDDIAPWVAIGFKSKKSRGKYRYIWLLKGKFEVPDDEYATEEDKIKLGTAKIKGTFSSRDYDGNWRYIGDEEEPGFNTSTAVNWFNAVYSPTMDLEAPIVSTTPANNATGVRAGSNVVFTFNKAIQPDEVNVANIFLMKSDGADVPSTLALSSDYTTVTLKPKLSLATGSYVAIATTNIKSTAGIALTQKCVVNFTV
jgi:phi13 family phage major tail protein